MHLWNEFKSCPNSQDPVREAWGSCSSRAQPLLPSLPLTQPSAGMLGGGSRIRDTARPEVLKLESASESPGRCYNSLLGPYPELLTQ